MQSEDRLIHFSTELIHPPAQHKKADMQRLYFDLSKTKDGAYDNTDFSAPMQPRFHSRRGQKTQSIALFLPDRLVLVEEWVDTPLSSFIRKIHDVAGRAFDVLGLKPIIVQTVTLRSTFALSHFADARMFLIDHMCGQAGRVAPHLQRPIAVGGLKFVLPETPDHPGTLHVGIESFRHSQDEVFVEVKGIFTNQNMGPNELEQSDANVHLVRAFISNHIFPFLNQYDVPQGQPL
ncbi:MAG TPA: hypothetical protein PLO37_24480 [Candidatus Hydrogenedentes bacterium]|nr:hypothetical protein [Candidatus Hydrogenedentota bacterium]HPG70018.1 hypothetical protein [Candidatus Hydrogenedentota bacterium]